MRVTGDMESFLCNGEIVKTSKQCTKHNWSPYLLMLICMLSSTVGRSKFIAYTSIDIVVAIVSVISITLCIRSLIQTYHLAQVTLAFVKLDVCCQF